MKYAWSGISEERGSTAKSTLYKILNQKSRHGAMYTQRDAQLAADRRKPPGSGAAKTKHHEWRYEHEPIYR